MTKEEIKPLRDKVFKADELQNKIESTQEKIRKINFEISTQQDGSGELNIRIKDFPVIPFERVYGDATDEEVIALGEFMIDALQKRINKWKAELEEL